MYSRSFCVCCCVLLDQSDAVFRMTRYILNTSLRNGFTVILYIYTLYTKLVQYFINLCFYGCLKIISVANAFLKRFASFPNDECIRIVSEHDRYNLFEKRIRNTLSNVFDSVFVLEPHFCHSDFSLFTIFHIYFDKWH